jgi:hypothetical protein
VPALSLSPASPAAASAAYCRQARRLRATLGNDPARLLAALQDLSATTNRRAQRRPGTAEPETVFTGRAPRATICPATLFSSRVKAALTGGILRYSDRQDLLREAAHLGLDRFEATLLIAAVQHGASGESMPASARRIGRGLGFRTAAVLTAIAVQGLIVAGMWWVSQA